MKQRLKRILHGAGVFACAGVVGAAWELYLDTRFHFTEPLSPVYGIWSFFHRAKFYGALGVACGLVAAGLWFGVYRLLALIKKDRRSTPVARVGYAAAFAAAFAGTPLWFFLGSWDFTLRAQDTARIISILVVSFLAFAFVFLRAASISRRVNAVARGAMVVAGWAAVFAYVGTAAVTWVARPRPAGNLPDVVIITLDACRADEFGRRADGATLTPNIDRFAAGAYVFRQCRAQATWTSPSLATMHTGQYPTTHGATAERPLGISQPTLAGVLRYAGYDTEAVVANRLVHRGSGLARGFNRYYYWNEKPFARWFGYYETYYSYLDTLLYERRNIDSLKNEGHTKVVTNLAVRILKAKRRRPLFLWCHYLDPHNPYVPPPRFVALGDRRLIGAIREWDRERSPMLIRHYDGEVRYVDYELARVFAALPRGAVVVISSDHGEEFWEHNDYDHGKNLYDTSLHIPLILRIPGAKPAVTDAPVGLIDVAPTILSILNLRVPPSMQGRNIAGAPRAPSWDYPVFFGSSMLVGMGRDGVLYRDHKLLLERKKPMGEAEFYDLKTDAGEKKLITKRDEPPRRKMERLLKDWIVKNLAAARRYESPPFSRAVVDRLRAMGYVR